MRIFVTQADMKKAAELPHSTYPEYRAFVCMVSCALYRHTGAQWSVGLAIADLPYTRSRAGRVMVELPPHVAEAIRAWDRGFPVHPFSFDIPYEPGKPQERIPWGDEPDYDLLDDDDA